MEENNKYKVAIDRSQGVQVGERNTQTNLGNINPDDAGVLARVDALSAQDKVALTEELAQLLAAARTKATGDQWADMPKLEKAEAEAKQGNHQGAVQVLKESGRWVLDLAKDVSARVIAELLMPRH